jgi:hypothetical protein
MPRLGSRATGTLVSVGPTLIRTACEWSPIICRSELSNREKSNFIITNRLTLLAAVAGEDLVDLLNVIQAWAQSSGGTMTTTLVNSLNTRDENALSERASLSCLPRSSVNVMSYLSSSTSTDITGKSFVSC